MINISIDENFNKISIDISPEHQIVNLDARGIDNEEAKKILINAIEGLKDL